MKAIVVGAGIGGLASGARLARSGWDVTIYERQETIGGKAGTNNLKGYRFDTGPSLLTMTGVFEEFFKDAGKRLGDYLDIEPLDTICEYFFPDGTRFHGYGDPELFAREVAEKTEDTAVAFLDFLDHCRKIYETGAELFLERSLHEWSTYLRLKTVSSLLRFRRIDPFRTMDAAHRSAFKDPRMVQLFNRYATYNGSSPYKTPATLDIIPYVEYGLGGYAVKGGIIQIPKALAALNTDLGVNICLDQPVSRIVTNGRKVTGVAFDQKSGTITEHADAVICNADVSVAYRDLLADQNAPLAKRYRRLEPSSSGIVFYWGVKGEFPEMGVNNIFFSDDYPDEFVSIFDRLETPNNPTVYVNVTSKVSPGDAPKGCENWFVLVNAPRHEGQDWNEQVARVRKAVLARLEKALGRNIGKAIQIEDTMTPEDIERKTGSHKGSLYGISSNSKMAAFLRHPNRSRRYPGLYFCGGSAHPGGGMPLALLSGRIAADLAIGRRGT